MVPEGRTACASCGAQTQSKNLTDFERVEHEMKVGELKETGFFHSKGGILLMGVAEIFIGIFSTLYLLISLSGIGGEIVVLFVGGVGFMVVILPIAGVLLILLDNYRAGGIILIIGSILCLPIGMVGAYAGSRAMKLGGSS